MISSVALHLLITCLAQLMVLGDKQWRDRIPDHLYLGFEYDPTGNKMLLSVLVGRAMTIAN